MVGESGIADVGDGHYDVYILGNSFNGLSVEGEKIWRDLGLR